MWSEKVRINIIIMSRRFIMGILRLFDDNKIKFVLITDKIIIIIDRGSKVMKKFNGEGWNKMSLNKIVIKRIEVIGIIDLNLGGVFIIRMEGIMIFIKY